MRSLKKKVQMRKETWTEPRGTPLFGSPAEDKNSAEDSDKAREVEVKIRRV